MTPRDTSVLSDSANNVTNKLDKLALVFSAVCLVHCLMLPLVVTLLPVIGSTLFTHEQFHQIMLIVVLPTSVGAFALGCREHKQGSVAVIGGIGLALLIVAAFAVGSAWGENAEQIITVIGGLVLAVAHIKNFNYCRHSRCEGHHG